MKSISPYALILLLLLSGGCRYDRPIAGQWRAALIPDTAIPEIEIPFNLEIRYDTSGNSTAIGAIIRNGGEAIEINEVQILDDSIHFMLPVFEGTIDARMGRKRLDGTYTHRASGRSWSVPFYADFGITDRFPDFREAPSGNITGRWEVSVASGDQAEKQIGEFRQDGSRLTGTFLTTTGDYRWLEGKVAGSRMMFSAFDGAHALVFLADLVPAGTLENGIFCGGPSWKGQWRAVRNDKVTLPDPSTLTWLKPGYDKLEFTFPDLEGNPVSLSDSRFKDKAVIVQVIGSWCPNCMDETRYLTGIYNRYHDKGLEIIALCYESADRDKSFRAINRFKTDIGAPYIFLHAGEANKRKASESLPMLNRILSFPTSIFIDRQGQVKKIFTGFSGPGTGENYTRLTGEMEAMVREVIR